MTPSTFCRPHPHLSDARLAAPFYTAGIYSLHSIFVDIERHTAEPGMPASGVNSLRTFHTGKVVALTCLRPLSTEVMEASGGVLVTGGEPCYLNRRVKEMLRIQNCTHAYANKVVGIGVEDILQF